MQEFTYEQWVADKEKKGEKPNLTKDQWKVAYHDHGDVLVSASAVKRPFIFAV